MNVRELLVGTYAPLRGLTPRSVTIYEGTITHWMRFLGREPTLDDFEDIAVARFLQWETGRAWKGKPVSANTIAKHKATLIALWSFAAKKGLVRQAPSLPPSKLVHRTPKAATVDVLEAMIAAAASGRKRRYGNLPVAWFWRTLIRCAFETGERRGALIALRWSEVNLETCQITFLAETRKGRQRDIVRSISQTLANELRQHQGPPNALVWNYPGKPNSLYGAWNCIRKRAKVDVRGLHSVRKASASYLAAAGGNPSEHLGHANPRVTAAYLDPTIVRPRETAVSLLPTLRMDDPMAAEFIPDDDAGAA